MKTHQFLREIPAGLVPAEALCLSLREFLSGLISPAERFETELVCREVLVNAIEHGCGFDASKTVVLRMTVDEGMLSCRIEDNGTESYQMPVGQAGQGRCDEFDPKEGGNGMRLIECYTDRFAFLDEGRAVFFEKRLGKRSS